MLWLKFKIPVVIYDANAKNALGFNQNQSVSYEDFYNEWEKEYKTKCEEIEDCCQNLISVKDYAIYQSDELEDALQNEINQEWFYERVFDAYLWHNGL